MSKKRCGLEAAPGKIVSKKWWGFAAALVLVDAGVSLAQTPGVGIEFEPYIGVFVPLADVIDEESINVVGQEEGFALGGRVLFKLGGAMGIEGNFLYALSDVEGEAGVPSETDAYAWAADGRLHLTLIPGPVSLHLTGGVAIVGRGGDAWEKVVEGDVDVGGVVGLGTKFGLGPLSIRGDADVYIYSAKLTVQDPTAGTVELGAQSQADLVLSAGLILSY